MGSTHGAETRYEIGSLPVRAWDAVLLWRFIAGFI